MPSITDKQANRRQKNQPSIVQEAMVLLRNTKPTGGIMSTNTANANITRTLRPQVSVPAQFTLIGTSYWAANETKKAQYSGWSPDFTVSGDDEGTYVRFYGELAEKLFAKYGASRINGEEGDGESVLTFYGRQGTKGLYFEPTEEWAGYVSLSELSITRVHPGATTEVHLDETPF